MTVYTIVRRRLRCIKELVMLHMHPWGREGLRLLTDMKDSYSGLRCFIIGNGPSLQKMDLSFLRDEITFGLNRIYLLFSQLGFQSTFLVSINHLVLRQFAAEILSYAMPKFLPWSSRLYIPADRLENTAFIDLVCAKPGFSKDVRGPIWHGATVTFAALQLACHMGFSEVILIGVDHNFTTKGPAGKEIMSEGDDLNHFSPQYFGKGSRWQLPDIKTSEVGYHLARQAYEQAGRQVLDATVDGKLTIFPKVRYTSLF
jgi:hypothetical protein